MKFLCDQMLGTLAKWLRIYGFDTYYASRDIKDLELIEIAKKESRVLITRDKELLFGAKRENLHVIEITSTDLEEQIGKILSVFKTDSKKYLSRCLICNSLLEEIGKEKAKGKIPKKVFENNKKFWLCKKCKKIYWRGTHYENMLSKTKQNK